MPTSELAAVLTYLRWLDRMEAYNGRKFPQALSQVAQRKREKQLYSWSGDFGSPIILPQIKKFASPEKYRSTQITKTAFPEKKENRKPQVYVEEAKKSKPDEMQDEKAQTGRIQRPLKDYYKAESWFSEELLPTTKKSKSATSNLKTSKTNRKQTTFRIHAKSGFKYWPEDLRKSPKLPGKFSFGERFNPGRAGVLNDRIYSKPRTNYHYWNEYQQNQNPIGSGNLPSDKKLKSRLNM